MADLSAFVEDKADKMHFILEWGALDGATDTAADVCRVVDERS